MARQSLAWAPQPGRYASYTGRTSRLLRGGRMVEVVAEASGRRMVVRAIGHSGRPVEFTVATKNLGRPQPGLFD
ncbi:MAG: hypothetical protein OEL20_05270 [Sulfuritalea sp.]|nr:hypothetical protein [Sulfuritalea sp.]